MGRWNVTCLVGKECEVVLEAEGYWVWLSIVRLTSVHNLEPDSWRAVGLTLRGGRQGWVYFYPLGSVPVICSAYKLSSISMYPVGSLSGVLEDAPSALLRDPCAHEGNDIVTWRYVTGGNTMLAHKGAHKCTGYQDTLGLRLMIGFVIISSAQLLAEEH